MRDDAVATPTESFRLGDWDVYPRLNRIEGAGEARHLEPKVMRVLVHLAGRAGEVVGQQDLIDAVWGQVAVSPNVLTYSIAALRKALDDDWRAPTYVETISKSGYRLVAQVGAASPAALAATADGAVVAASGADRAGTSSSPDAGNMGAESAPRSLSPRIVGIGVLAVVAALALATQLRPSPALDAAPAVDPMGLQPLPATALPGAEIHPALSPDGNHLVFAWRPRDSDHYDLYVKLLGSEAPALLVGTPGRDASPAWTPDGLQVVYASVTRDECGIFQIPATGGASRRLVDCPGLPVGNLAISPDGKTLAVGAVVASGTPTRIFLVTLADGEIAEIGAPDATDQGDYYPAFSPHGSQVAFLRIRGDGLSDLLVADLASDGSNATRRVTFDNRDIGGLDWMADGEHIVFSSYRTGQYRLWKVSTASGELTSIAINDHQMTSLSLARLTGRLAYYRPITQTNLWGARVAPAAALPYDPDTRTWADAAWPADGAPEQLVSSTRWEGHPDLSSDGARVAFASDRSGYFEIWSAALDGSDPIQHTTFEGPFVGYPRFARDDSRLLFDARPEGHADVWVVDVRGRQPQRLTDDPGDDFAATYSRDGASVLFTSNRSGSWEVWRMPAAGGPALPVTATGAYAAQEGPDGYLYYTKPDRPGVWRVALGADGTASGDEEIALGAVPLTHWGSWQVSDAGIHFIDSQTNVIGLWDTRAQTHTPLHPMSGQPSRQHPSLAVSDAGDFLVYAQVDQRELDIMVVDGVR
jgi:Tol biopolymer transport system component/DNA-binding winged helix-turn-helix (wHTH) protein